MKKSLDSMENLLLFYGAGGAPLRENERHGIRYVVEVIFGQIIGFFVAVWIILRSIDSVLSKPEAPLTAPSAKAAAAYVPTPIRPSNEHHETPLRGQQPRVVSSAATVSPQKQTKLVSERQNADISLPPPHSAIHSVGSSGGVPAAAGESMVSSEVSGDTDEELVGTSDSDSGDDSDAGGGRDTGCKGACSVGSTGGSQAEQEQQEQHDPHGTIPLPPKSEWPDYPILVRCSEDTAMKIDLAGVSAYGALPINDAERPIPFETNLFKGVAMIRIADLKTSPLDYFTGKRRKMQVHVAFFSCWLFELGAHCACFAVRVCVCSHVGTPCPMVVVAPRCACRASSSGPFGSMKCTAGKSSAAACATSQASG
jgi:hypothetical protein